MPQKNPEINRDFPVFGFFGCGGSNRTNDLKVMSLASYHCSTPRKNGIAECIDFLEKSKFYLRQLFLFPFRNPFMMPGDEFLRDG